MEHLVVKATTTTTDTEAGTFTALVSAWSADREGDTIDRHAFDQSVSDWQASGKALPLLLEHSTTVVGAIDPATMHTEAQGLVVSGSIDRESDEGQRVWRAIKSNVASFSIGFLATKTKPREGGGRDLITIDLLEISVVATPAHPATRTLSWKTAADQPGMSDAEFQVMTAIDREHIERSRERFRKQRQDRELEELVSRYATAKKDDRPITVKTFRV